MDKSKFIDIPYEQLSPEQLQYLMDIGVLNGFGGARQSNIVRFFIGLVLNKFKIAIALKHDLGYWLAIKPRKECDEKFFLAMVEDCLRIYDKEKSKIDLILNFSLCYMAYIAIRLFGWKYYGK